MAGGANEPLSIGTVVRERYLILQIVGQGGLGTVYQVRDEVYGKGNIFALKELIDRSAGARKQFELESLWLQSLDHNSIPKVREHFEWHDRLYLVMDYVDGENLEQKLARLGGRPMGESQALAWIMPVCDALQYLHTRTPPILHRDVKPANIIVTSGGHPVLVDLGIAKEHLPGAGRTATFVRKAGTEGYAPPEQYTAAGQTGPWSDVYGLGATLYQLLTGGIPPTAVERVALDAKLLHPRSINPGISAQVDAAICKALAIRPADRFQSVSEFARALAGQPFPPLDRFNSPPAAYPSAPPGYVSQPPYARPDFVAPAPSPVKLPQTGGITIRPSARPVLGETPQSGSFGGARQENPPGASDRYAASGIVSWPEQPYPEQPGEAFGAKRKAEAPFNEPAQRERRFGLKSRVALGAVLVILLAVAFWAGVTAIRNATPPDRSSPTATINGYYAALKGQNYSRAWVFLTDSQTNVSDKSTVLSGLAADDLHYGRVLSVSIVSTENDSGGKVAARVMVTRALAPDAPQSVSIELSQYSGGTWLIDNLENT